MRGCIPSTAVTGNSQLKAPQVSGLESGKPPKGTWRKVEMPLSWSEGETALVEHFLCLGLPQVSGGLLDGEKLRSISGSYPQLDQGYGCSDTEELTILFSLRALGKRPLFTQESSQEPLIATIMTSMIPKSALITLWDVLLFLLK